MVSEGSSDFSSRDVEEVMQDGKKYQVKNLVTPNGNGGCST